jgi:hypothetical protein
MIDPAIFLYVRATGLIRQELSRIDWSYESARFQWITKSPCLEANSLWQKMVKRGFLETFFGPARLIRLNQLSLP